MAEFPRTVSTGTLSTISQAGRSSVWPKRREDEPRRTHARIVFMGVVIVFGSSKVENPGQEFKAGIQGAGRNLTCDAALRIFPYVVPSHLSNDFPEGITMLRLIKTLTLCAALCGCLGSRAFAQNADKTKPAIGPFRADFLSQLDDVEKKVMDLADAVPAEKYSWRPEEGVRSISEVYVHIADANYLFPTIAGAKALEGMMSDDNEKKITGKKDVMGFVKKSFAYIRQVVTTTADDDLAKPAKLFGQQTTVQNVYFTCANHMHEHLGQSIAYARTNHIVPPWTAAE